MHNNENIRYMRDIPEDELSLIREMAIRIAGTDNPVTVFNVMMDIITIRKKYQINNN